MSPLPPPHVTGARLRGLLAFGVGGVARESNVTNVPGHLVYWQTRAWLSANEYIETRLISERAGEYFLTEKGKRLLRDIFPEAFR
jgi:hypothetical protein